MNNGDKTMDMTNWGIMARLSEELPADVMINTVMSAWDNAADTLGMIDNDEAVHFALCSLTETSGVCDGVENWEKRWEPEEVIEMINRIAGKKLI